MQPAMGFLIVGALACERDDSSTNEYLFDLYVSTHDGTRTVGNVFLAKEDVFLGVSIKVERPYGAVARDYWFHVVDDQGLVLSTDDPACRRVRVGNAGLSLVVDDALDACPHARRPGGVGLAPFADSLGRYRAQLVDAHGGVTEIELAVGMIPDEGGVCGNGERETPEQCDDGNLDAGDGCDAFCAVEYAPVCGDGVVDHGESCDDGNTMCMDGCDERCRIEPPADDEE